jgi:hypothetical protein
MKRINQRRIKMKIANQLINKNNQTPKKTIILGLKVLLLAVLTHSSLATAIPFTYQVAEKYYRNDNPAIFGTAALVNITVDNGNSTNLNQTYTWGDITAASVSTVGGTFTHAWTNPMSGGPLINDLFSVDANGIATLADWNNTAYNSYFVSDSRGVDGVFLQLGSGNNVNLELAINNFRTTAFSVTTYDTLSVTQVVAVPEPNSIALLAAGLCGLFVSIRKRTLSI